MRERRPLLEADHPMFARAWVRWVTVLVPLAWGAMEIFWNEAPMWGALFLLAGGYAAKVLLLTPKRPVDLATVAEEGAGKDGAAGDQRDEASISERIWLCSPGLAQPWRMISKS